MIVGWTFWLPPVPVVVAAAVMPVDAVLVEMVAVTVLAPPAIPVLGLSSCCDWTVWACPGSVIVTA